MIDWIPREERLPEKDIGQVLIWLVKRPWWDAEAKSAYFADDQKNYYYDEYSWLLEDTSHWAYINEPSEEGE